MDIIQERDKGNSCNDGEVKTPEDGYEARLQSNQFRLKLLPQGASRKVQERKRKKRD